MSVCFDPDMLARWCDGRWQGGGPARIAGVSSDSRTVQPDQLYVAIKGDRFDGHDFVAAAAARQASAALVAATYAEQVTQPPLPLLVVPDTRAALTACARGHRGRCRGTVIGVTGSVGKTSVKEMTADLLSELGGVARTRLNWNNDLGVPLSLLQMSPDALFGVFEVGMNHPGELAPLCALIQPAWAIITPIGPAHLEFFPDVDAIAHEKAALLEALPPGGVAVLSLDDPYYAVLAEHLRGQRVVHISLQADHADYYGEWQNGATPQLAVREKRTGTVHYYPLPLPGRYVADNALRAIAVAREQGLAPERLATRLAAYRPPAMRWIPHEMDGVTFINDAYNANPVSMRAAVDALRDMTVPGRKWLVLAGMFELGAGAEEAHRDLGRYLAGFPWGGVVTVGRWGEAIAAGARVAGLEPDQLWACPDVDEAAACLRDRVQPGDVVLLKASRGEKLESILKHWDREHN